MPVEKPLASWRTALGLGFLSAVFDNIPLTALALKQNGYDWGMLAYAVGFGGSMIWFGSSAGVATSNLFPEVRSVGAWVKEGWLTAVAYVVGFVVLLMLLGWHPAPKLRPEHGPPRWRNHAGQQQVGRLMTVFLKKIQPTAFQRFFPDRHDRRIASAQSAFQ
jgi:hypothetical protein